MSSWLWVFILGERAVLGGIFCVRAVRCGMHGGRDVMGCILCIRAVIGGMLGIRTVIDFILGCMQ